MRVSTWYVPILRGRKAEIAALSAARATVASALRPVLEFAPGVGERPEIAIRTLVERPSWARRIGLDCHAFYADERLESVNLLPTLAETLMGGPHQVPVVPVLWLGSPDRLVDEAAAVAAGAGAGISLRLEVTGPPPDGREVDALLSRARLDHAQTDLILDVGAVTRQAAVAAAAARTVAALDWVQGRGWRSVTVAAAGCPASPRPPVSSTVATTPRNDAAVWAAVRAVRPEAVFGFGDFGVRARPSRGTRGSSTPYLRYTVDGEWELHRWPVRADQRHDPIRPLCAALTRSPGFARYGSAYSWGDGEFARATLSPEGLSPEGLSSEDQPAGSVGGHPGGVGLLDARAAGFLETRPGRRDTRGRGSVAALTGLGLAWSTSHHLAVVAERLRTTGLP